MSEYQYYEWLTIDRPLTPKEQAEVERLSSHIEVTATRAVVTYEWGDFKHDPKQVLVKYFDAFMYYANWGSQWLAFRFPTKLLDPAQIEPYLWEDAVTLEPTGEYMILTVAPQDEEGYEDVDYEASLATLAGVREEILNGDLRALYLAWLIVARSWDDEYGDEDEDESDEEGDGEVLESPVPPGLQDLTAAQSAMADYFGLDPFLIQAAAEASSPRSQAGQDTVWRELLGRLPAVERDDFLLRLAQGEPHLSGMLKHRLRELAGAHKISAPGERRRSLGELMAQADRLRAEAQRQEKEAAEARRRRELQALAASEPQVWRDVDELLLKKTASAYDRAAALLRDLRDLASTQGRLDEFQARLAGLEAQYARSRALLERLQKLR